MEKECLWSRNFILCTVLCFFYTMYFFMFFTGMTSYSLDVLGTDSTVAGLIASIFIAGDLLSRMVFGGRLNRLGKKRVIIVSLAVGSAVSLLYYVIQSVPGLCILRLVHGFTYGAMASAVNTYVAEILPASRRGEGMGYFMLSLSLGSALGPFLCMKLIETGSYGEIFSIGVLSSLIGLAVSLFLQGGKPQVQVSGRKVSQGFLEKKALGMSLVVFVFFFSYSGVLSFMSPYGKSIGLESYATYFFVTLSVGTLICRLFLGRLYDLYGENVAIIPMYILFIIGMFLMSTTSDGYVLLSAGVLMGLNIAMLSGVGQAICVRLSSPERYGAAVSTYNIFLDLAYAVGPVINGEIIGMFGYRDNYLLMTFMALTSLFLYIAVHGAKHPGKPMN